VVVAILLLFSAASFPVHARSRSYGKVPRWASSAATTPESKRPGQTISKGHKNYELMLQLQLGIRWDLILCSHNVVWFWERMWNWRFIMVLHLAGIPWESLRLCRCEHWKRSILTQGRSSGHGSHQRVRRSHYHSQLRSSGGRTTAPWCSGFCLRLLVYHFICVCCGIAARSVHLVLS